LSKFALHHKLKAFYIPHNVGGRFSVLSAVGVVVLHFAGYDVEVLLRGAANFIERFFEKKEKHLLDLGVYRKNKFCKWQKFLRADKCTMQSCDAEC